jgi:hypothetical protein
MAHRLAEYRLNIENGHHWKREGVFLTGTTRRLLTYVNFILSRHSGRWLINSLNIV